MITLRLLLLPGMDGTGQLFSALLKALPEWVHPQVVTYPTRDFRSFTQLLAVVHSAMPQTEPFVILAESFSTPLAVQIAANPPANLRGLILCAGFITPPTSPSVRSVLSALAPLLFRLRLPSFVVKFALTGRNAPFELVKDVQRMISSVAPEVLARRVRAVLACNETRTAARIAIPALYLRPTQDRLVSQRTFRALCSAMPGVAVMEIPGPHLILQREPRASADAITAFLNRALPPSTTSS